MKLKDIFHILKNDESNKGRKESTKPVRNSREKGEKWKTEKKKMKDCWLNQGKRK